MSRCLFESVPALRGTEIVGFPLDRGLNALPFWEVGLTERVFDHHIIDPDWMVILPLIPPRLFRPHPLLE